MCPDFANPGHDELAATSGDQVNGDGQGILDAGGCGEDCVRLSFQYCSGDGLVFCGGGHFYRATVAWQPAILVRLDRLGTPASYTANAPDTVACIKHTDLPGTSKLFADLLYHFERVNRFYAHDPSQESAYDTSAKQIDYPEVRRVAMAKVLAGQNPPSELLDAIRPAGNGRGNYGSASWIVRRSGVHLI